MFWMNSFVPGSNEFTSVEAGPKLNLTLKPVRESADAGFASHTCAMLNAN